MSLTASRALLRLAVTELRANRSRTAALTTTVALATMLVVASRVLDASTQTAIEESASAPYSTADVLVRSEVSGGGAESADAALGGSGSALDTAALARIADLEQVRTIGTYTRARAAAQVGDVTRGIALESLPADVSLVWQRWAKGRSPTSGTEIALTGETLDALHIGVGDRVAIGHPGVGRAQFTVVGEVSVNGATDYAGAYGVVTEPVARSLAGTGEANVAAIRLTPDAAAMKKSADAAIDAINDTSPGGFAQTTADLAHANEAAQADRASGISAAVTALSLLAVAVAALVLGAVASASITARRRSTALVRAVGATRGQTALQVLVEVVAVGLLGLLLGLGAGLLLARMSLPAVGLLPGLPDVPGSAYTIDVSGVALALVLCAALTLLAVVVPAWHAVRVPPVAALSETPYAADRRSLVASVAVSIAAVVAAAAALGLGSGLGAMLTGTALLLVAGLVGLRPALVTVARLTTLIRRPVARLAASEILRDPRRAVAEGVALAVAACLVAMTWVGLASVGSTVSQRLSASAEPDLTVGAPTGTGVIPDDTVAAIENVDGVASVTAVGYGPGIRLTGRDGDRRVALSVGTAAVSTADLDRALPDGSPVAALRDDTVYLPRLDVATFPADGRITATGPDGSVTDLAVSYVDDLAVPSLVTPALMERLADTTEVRTLWVSLESGADRTAVLDAVSGQAVLGGQLPVSGPTVLDQRAGHALSAARATATALLAVAVLVAVIGASTTASLSVTEQWREHAIVRALGLDARRLRRVVALRLALISLTSCVVGALVGTVIGQAAARSVAAALGIDAAVSVPWIPVVAIVLVIAALAQLATTGPVERAALVRPARALQAST